MEQKTARELQSESTRERIVQAATRLFLRKGFAAASIADLAGAVEATKGALYHHFESKEAILSAVVKTIKKTWGDAVGRQVISERDPVQRLEKLLENHAKFLQENEAFCLVLNSLSMEMQGVNPGLLAELQSVYTDMARFIEQIIKKGRDAGKLRADIDPRHASLTIVGMLRGTGCSRPAAERMKYDYAATMDMLKKIVVKGLKA